jgi:GWxTD domain-containing protein
MSKLVRRSIRCAALAGVLLLAGSPGQAGVPSESRDRIDELKKATRPHNAPDSLRYQLALAHLDAGTIEDRIRAHDLFEQVKRSHGDQPRYHWARARLYKDCQQPSVALACLREVVKLDSMDVEAWVEMARLHMRELLYHFDLDLTDRMLESLDEALALDPEHREALFLTSLTLLLADQRPERTSPEGTRHGMACLDRILARDPADTPARLLLAVHCLDSGRTDDAEHHFNLAFRSGSEDLREGFATCRWTASDRVLVQAAAYTGDQRVVYDRSYWQAFDPTPLTLLNENQLATWKRLVMADLLFGTPEDGTRGWETEPGEAFVRYGVPTRHDFDPGEIMGGPGADVTLPKLGSGGLTMSATRALLKLEPPAWSWDYQFHGLEFSLRFEDKNLNGTFRHDSPSAMRMETLRKSSPTVFQEAPPGDIRHVYLATAGQAGSGVKVRQTVNLGLPLWRGDGDRAWLDKVSVVIDVKDSTRARVKRSRRIGSKGGLVTLFENQVPVLLFSDVYDLNPGRYTVTALIDDDGGKRHGSLTVPIEVRNYPVMKTLGISDLELVLATEGTGALPAFARYGAGYVANPLCVPGNGKALDIFYEIYGLSTRDTLTEHTTRYTVLPRRYVLGYERLVKDGKVAADDLVEFAADEMASGGDNLSAANYLDVGFPAAVVPAAKGRTPKGTRVGVPHLEPGEYALILTVTDTISGSTASARSFFRILNDQQLRDLAEYTARK